jgi:hypothetical protein
MDVNPSVILDQLSKAAASDSFEDQLGDIADSWTNQPNAFEAIDPILQFMEAHPELEYGTPGPLVHFVETFYRKGYEQKLVGSVQRKPTLHTTWMLNRLINGATDPAEKRLLVGVLQAAARSNLADAETKRLAADFIARLEP